ncbi:MAG: 6-phosphogluconolactonase [Gammaproteobacteria bacterium]|nr:6-phosphogluconolactonase [Gammaproteobacteria bacterium]
MHHWYVSADFDKASQQAAEFLADAIGLCVDKKGSCHVVLPGGNTPAKCLGLLAQQDLPWDKVHWYPGDERCYPVAHAERNDVMLEQHLWSHLSVAHVHRIAAELGAEKAALLFSELISAIEHFDIAFLGIGEDGHTASLFPGNEALLDSRPAVPVHHSPKAPQDRVSLSISTLKQATTRLVLASGVGKRDIISRIKQQESLPVNMLGSINWFIDESVLAD